MGVQTSSWERQLLCWAREALDSHTPMACPPTSATLLDAAFRRCEAITAEHSRTFAVASGLLPMDKRRAVRALYAFCRVSDDLVDQPSDAPQAALQAWRQRALDPCPPGDDEVALAWAETRARYAIPVRYAEQLIAGIASDLDGRRYASFEELAAYCYGVASTVGLMAMHIIGFAGPEALPYALKLGIALQLTNILRDVGEDWRAGRLYLPLDELAAYGLGEQDIAAQRVDGRWRAFIRFQIERTRRLYCEALPGIALLARDGRLAIQAAAELYRAILDDIECHDGDVFSRRAHVSAWGKLRRLPGIWWRALRVNPPAASTAGTSQ